MKLILPNSISSLQDVATLEGEMREYAKWFSHNEIKARVHAKHPAPPPALSEAALELLRTWNSRKVMTQKDLDEMLSELASFKHSAETMTITLAAPAGKELRSSLVAWCRKNISPTILVAFQFNASLLGGMVVRHGSHVFDWSFRRQILATRHKFPEVLRSV